MSGEIFLIDANSLITPYLTYYQFDIVPGFWNQLREQIKNGRVVILDMVKNEIIIGKDSLKTWMETLEIGKYIDHRDPRIVQKYREILDYIQANPCYKQAALAEWAGDNIADPWLIATASVYNYTLITFEEPNKGLNEINPSKNAKIPDVSKVFGVKTNKLFYRI